MSESLIRRCMFAIHIFAFSMVTAASESAMKAISSVAAPVGLSSSLQDQCIAALHNHPTYLEPDRYMAEWREKDMSIDGQENWLIALDQLRTSWCLQKVNTAPSLCLKGHTDILLSVAYNHDRTQLASGSIDRTVRIWNPFDGICLHVLKGHSGPINSIAYNHDGTQIASGSRDRVIRLWSPVEGICLQVLNGHTGSVNSIAYNHDGTQIASGSDDGTIRIWNPADGICLRTLEGHGTLICTIAYSHDGAQTASRSNDMCVRLWNSANGTCEHALECRTYLISSIAYNPDGTQLALGSSKEIQLWNPADGERLHELKGYRGRVTSITYNHDGTEIASFDDATVRLWNPLNGVCLDVLDVNSITYSYVGSLTYNPDGTLIAATSKNGSLFVQPILRKTHLTSLSDKKRLGLFKALIAEQPNEYCSAIIKKLSMFKLIKPFKGIAMIQSSSSSFS